MIHLEKRSRREVLAALGGAGAVAALSPFVPLFGASAGGTTPPMRLLVFVTAMGMGGTYPDPWRPGGGETDFVLRAGSVLEPLAPFRDRILVIDGLDNRGGMDTNLPGGHPVGLGTILTGGRLIEGPGMVGGGARDWTARTFGPSIDQLVAQRLGVRSLELAVDIRRTALPATYKSRISFRSASEPVPPSFDPRATFDRLFAGIGSGPTPPPPSMRRRHVLDFVHEDLRTLRTRVGRDDRLKMDAHLAALERLQAELEPTPVPAGCTAPTLPGGTQLPSTARSQMAIVKSAFECDLVRVASIMWGGSPHGWQFDWLGTELASDFHTLSHAGAGDAAAQADLLRANRWYAEQFRDLLASLDSVPEGDGTMLDHTLVLWATEVSRGNNHSHRNMPFVLAGGTRHFRSGRYLSYSGMATNALYVSIAQAMGLADVDTFGDPAYGTGPLPNAT